MDALIREFMKAKRFALLGASRDPEKYGNIILNRMTSLGYEVWPVNPKEAEIEEIPCVASVADLHGGAAYVDVVLPPAVTVKLIPDLVKAGCEIAWLQPGAESPALVAALEAAGIRVIHGGPCIMVAAKTVR